MSVYVDNHTLLEKLVDTENSTQKILTELIEQMQLSCFFVKNTTSFSDVCNYLV